MSAVAGGDDVLEFVHTAKGPIGLRAVSAPERKAAICAQTLRALPQWFGIEEANLAYIEAVRALPFLAATAGDEAVGFFAVKRHNPYTSELYALGLQPEYHRLGIGRTMVRRIAREWANQGGKLLTVKTLSAAHPDKGYAATRRFYEAMGFVPVEELPQLWGPENPCLLMAKLVAVGP